MLAVLLKENSLAPWEALAVLCRDFSVIIFGIYLTLRGKLSKWQFRSIWYGKVTTAMQLAVLFGLTCRITFPPFVYISFIVLGLLALIELYQERSKLRIEG